MKAIILAAGRGSRLGDLTRDYPKCLIPIYGELSSLDMIIDGLENNGIRGKSIVIVVGYMGDVIGLKYSESHEIVVNDVPEYENCYSLYLALKKIRGRFILINSDVVTNRMDVVIARMLRERISKMAISVSDVNEESMKVGIDRIGRITGIEKGIIDYLGEYAGVCYLDSYNASQVRKYINRNIEKFKRNWYESAIQSTIIVKGIEIYPEIIPEWIDEVDTLEDLERVRRIFKGGHP